MFPSEKQREREREARPTTWASKYYQVDLIFLTLVRDTAFIPSAITTCLLHFYPLLPHPWHLPRLSRYSPLQVASSLGRERVGSKWNWPHSSLPAVDTYQPPWASGHLHGWVGAKPWACVHTIGIPESQSHLSIRTRWLCSWHRA